MFVASFFITATMPLYTETIIISDNPVIPVVIASLVIVVLLATIDRLLRKVSVTKLAIIFGCIMFVAALGWALLADTFPWFDSLDLINSALDLGYGNGYWQNGAYMNRFPFQTGYLMLIKLISKIFPNHIYECLELANSVFAALTVFFLMKYAQLLFGDKPARFTGYFSLLFLPLAFYSTFAYGNVPCLPFAVAAMYFQAKCLDNFKVSTLLLSCVSLAISIIFKSTMLVVLIAMVMVWLFDAFKKGGKALLAVVATVACYFVLSKGLLFAVSAHYAVDLNNGNPSIAWVAMGLSANENLEVGNNPGWYNGFVWLIDGEDYSPEAMSELAKESLSNSLAIFAANPGYALRFISTKIVSIWLEPTYTSLVNGNYYPIMTEREMSPLLQEIYYGNTNGVILAICDAVQFLTLALAVLFLVKGRKQLDEKKLLPAIAFVGFFLIYLVWEGKSQYSMPAYTFLLAYAGVGAQYLYTALASLKAKVTRTDAMRAEYNFEESKPNPYVEHVRKF